jgi:hypothetical protein
MIQSSFNFDGGEIFEADHSADAPQSMWKDTPEFHFGEFAAFLDKIVTGELLSGDFPKPQCAPLP